VHASSGKPPAELDLVVRRAGGVLVLREGRSVVASYGSAAGELAVCVSAVGVADCSELTKLVVRGPSPQLGQLTRRLTSTEVRPGGAVLAAGAWWCAESPERMVLLCDPRLGDRLVAAVHARVAGRSALVLEDRTRDWAALRVVGRRARPLLAQLGVYGESGDPRQVPPVTNRPVAGVDALWLLESDHGALALVPRAVAASVWRAIEHAGQSFGICAVGQEAIARYALIPEASPGL
jgi:glycine cleavage system aminomethyltransferase T